VPVEPTKACGAARCRRSAALRHGERCPRYVTRRWSAGFGVAPPGKRQDIAVTAHAASGAITVWVVAWRLPSSTGPEPGGKSRVRILNLLDCIRWNVRDEPTISSSTARSLTWRHGDALRTVLEDGRGWRVADTDLRSWSRRRNSTPAVGEAAAASSSTQLTERSGRTNSRGGSDIVSYLPCIADALRWGDGGSRLHQDGRLPHPGTSGSGSAAQERAAGCRQRSVGAG